MAQLCSVCKNPQRNDIERAIVAEGGLRQIAERFNLSTSALHRHQKDHMSAALQAQSTKTAVSAKSIILDLVGDLRAMAATCKESGIGKDFLLVADRLTRATEVYGKLTGEINPGTTNLFLSVGVRSEEELRSKLDMVKALEAQASPEESFADWVAMGRMLLSERPELKHNAAIELGFDSYAVEVGGDEREETPGNDADSAMTPRPQTNGGSS